MGAMPRPAVLTPEERRRYSRHLLMPEFGEDAQRRVKQARVLQSKPFLDEAALAAVKQWIFTPTTLNGVPVPVIMTVTVNFKLN